MKKLRKNLSEEKFINHNHNLHCDRDEKLIKTFVLYPAVYIFQVLNPALWFSERSPQISIDKNLNTCEKKKKITFDVTHRAYRIFEWSGCIKIVNHTRLIWRYFNSTDHHKPQMSSDILQTFQFTTRFAVLVEY